MKLLTTTVALALFYLLVFACGNSERNQPAKAPPETPGQERTNQPVMLKRVVQPRYDTFQVKSGLAAESAFEFMNKQYEPEIIVDQAKDALRKKASSIVMLIELWDWADMVNPYLALKCRARMKNDALNISLWHATGFSGAGVAIRVVDNRFHAKNYRFYDNEIGEEEPVVWVERQTLTLDKASYKTGDKLFGYLYLSTFSSDSIRAYAQGFFRATVEKGE